MADTDDRPAPDPDVIAGRSFASVRKGGFDHDEVRAFLLSVASDVRELQRVHADLVRRAEELKRRATDPKDLDEASVTALLGEETARVLSTSRQAAAEIRAKAEEEAASLRAETEEAVAALRSAADHYDGATRDGADAYAAEVRGAADQELADRRSELEAEVAGIRNDADAYATTLREATEEEVAELLKSTRAEAEQMRSEAETVLGERTAAAEVAANGIRAEAEAHASHAREEADRYAEVTRGSADQYRTEVQGAADAYRADATTEADRMKADAASAADALRSVAETEVTALKDAAQHEAATVLADAKEEGRAMVGEARTYRERVIADLSERRRASRTQLEQVGAARDAVAVALSDVVARIEVSHRSLVDTPIDPREAGDTTFDRRALSQPEPPAEPPRATSVGVGEIDGPIDVGDRSSQAEAEADGGGDGDGDGAQADSSNDDHDDSPPSGEAAAELADGGEVEAAVADAIEVDDRDAEEGSVGGSDDAGAGDSGVDDLFARIRSERGSGSDEEAPSSEDAGPRLVALSSDPDVDLEVVAGADGDGDETVVELHPDTALLERRDVTTDELERLLARRLKRVLADEQNEVLDLLRRTKGELTPETVLPAEEDHLSRYAMAALEDLSAAERAGAAFYGEAPAKAAEVTDTAEQFASELVRQIRGRLERAFDDGGDEQEIGDRIRSCYREWKTQRIADTARHYVVVAFSRGVAGSAADGQSYRWLVDDGAVPSPDCEDNALAGPVPAGEPFPTGDMCPPAHPGCRCLAVPAP